LTLLALPIKLLFQSQAEQYESERRRESRKTTVLKSASVFAVLRESEDYEREGDYDEAIAILEDYLDETDNSIALDMCRQRIARIEARRQPQSPASPPKDGIKA